MEEREGGGYRDAGGLLRCPECAVPMEARPFRDKVIDQCGTCAGLWVDWFDGPLHEACASALRELGWRAPVEPSGRLATCPRCRVALDSESRDSRALMRCPECAGAWMSREEARSIAESWQANRAKAAMSDAEAEAYEKKLSGVTLLDALFESLFGWRDGW